MSKPKRDEPVPAPAGLSPSAQRYFDQANEGAKRDFGNLRHEREALERVAERNVFLDELRLSPLEAPHGESGPLQDAITALRERWARAHGWPLGVLQGAPCGIGADWTDDPGGYMASLDSLEALLGRSLGAFEPLRFPRQRVDPRTGLIEPPGTDARPRLPAAVHREALRLFEALRHPLSEASTQADSLDSLAAVGLFAMDPLDDEHLASVVALACIATALEELEGWGPGTSTDRLDAIVARAQCWALDARRWLDHWDHEAMRRDRATAQRSEAASGPARKEAKRKKADTLQAVAKVLSSLPPSQQGSGAASVIAERLQMTARSVRSYLPQARALLAEKRK